MIKKLAESKYFKAGLTFLIAGAILILFYNWVYATQFAAFLKKINRTFMPIYIGIAIAFILCPVYNWFVSFLYKNFYQKNDVKSHKRALGLARVLASIFCLTFIVILIFLFSYFVIPQLVENIVTLADTMPARIDALTAWSDAHLAQFPEIQQTINSIANSGMTQVVEWIREHLFSSTYGGQSIAQLVSNGVLSVLSALIDVVVGLLISVYLLNYKERLLAIAKKLTRAVLSEGKSESLFEFGSVINDTFIGFMVGRILDGLIIGIITFAVLSIFGYNMPLLISVIIGVTNIIPVFGPFLGAIPSFILILTDSPMKALWFLLIILIIQQLDGNAIGPKIVGTAIGLPSFWVLFAVLIGGGMYGFLGMILGTPAFAVIYKYIDIGARRRLHKKGLPLDTDDYYYLNSFGIDRNDVFKEKHDQAAKAETGTGKKASEAKASKRKKE